MATRDWDKVVGKCECNHVAPDHAGPGRGFCGTPGCLCGRFTWVGFVDKETGEPA